MLKEILRSFRVLTRSPLFFLTSVVLLSVGIGLNTALFSLFNAALLSAFPFAEADRLLWVSGALPSQDIDSARISYPDCEAIQQGSTVFSDLAVFGSQPFNLAVRSGEPVAVNGAWVSSNLFSLLGMQPILGRTFDAAEARPGGERVVLLNERVWRNQLGSDPRIVGKTVRVNGRPSVVIGVMPMKAELAEVAQIWLPIEQDPRITSRHNRYVRGIARLKPHATVVQAETEVLAISQQLEKEFPDSNRGLVLHVESLREAWFGGARQILVVLLVMVLLVLLIACANVASLTLTRAISRSREFALRTALGASPGALMRQTMVESMVLGGIGCVVGLLLGAWGARLLLGAIPIELPVWFDLKIDFRVAAFAIAVSLLAVLVFGLPPILRARRLNLGDVIQQGGFRSTGGPRAARFMRLLVAGEVAMSLALCVSCGLMLKSFLRVVETRPGFETSNALSFNLNLEAARYVNETEMVATVDRIVERLASLPGVTGVGAISQGLPLLGARPVSPFVVEGKEVDERNMPIAVRQSVTPLYFQTMRIPLVRGRAFTPSDDRRTIPVAMVDRELARRFWPDENPIGKRLKLSGTNGEETWRTVVGVAEDVKQDGLDQALRPTIYLPYQQAPAAQLSMVVRTSGPPLGASAAVRRTVAEVEARAPLRDLMPMQEAINKSLWQWRFFSTMFWVASGVALLLTAVGVYGVMAYSVAQKTREIGIHMAMGAQRRDVLEMLLRQSSGIFIGGLLFGLLCAWGLGRAMSGFLYEVSGGDPGIFVVATGILVAVGSLATLLPSLRAMRVDPQIVLRTD